MPIMAFRLARPAHLIDINRVAGLDRLEIADGRLRIGAQVRHAAFHRPVVAGPLGALLASVVCDIAHYPIRMRGTFCGSLAHADPAAEWGLVAVTLDAELVAVSRRGERTIPASDFFQGVMETALAPDELLVEARLPLLPAALQVRLCRVQPPPRRLCPGDGAGRAGDRGRRHHRRRFSASAASRPVRAASPRPRRSWPVRRRRGRYSARRPRLPPLLIEPLEDPQTDAQYRRELVAAMVVRALAKACACRPAHDRPGRDCADGQRSGLPRCVWSRAAPCSMRSATIAG